MRRLELLDTSIVVVLLEVPHESDQYADTLSEFDVRVSQGIELQMPVAAVIESGSHVGRIENGHFRRECAKRLSILIESTLDRTAPWSFTPLEWDRAFLQALIDPDDRYPFIDMLAKRYLEMGDQLVVAEYRRIRGNLNLGVVDVDVWTYDDDLRAVIDDLRSAQS